MREVAIRLEIEQLDEGGFVATSPDVPGLVAEGETISETVEIARIVARDLLEVCIECGDPIPQALRNLVPDGGVLQLRVPVEV